MITCAAPQGAPGGVAAVAGADVLLDNVTSSVLAIRTTPSSYAVLPDADGRIIAHPDAALALTSITGVRKDLSNAPSHRTGSAAAFNRFAANTEPVWQQIRNVGESVNRACERSPRATRPCPAAPNSRPARWPCFRLTA